MTTEEEDEPQPIHKSAGECIKVLLGSSGSQYFVVEENIDDDDSRQSCYYWNQIPPDLANHVNQRCRQGRTLRNVAMGQNGEWFVCSVKSDGTDAAVACGGVSKACKDTILNVEQTSKTSLHLAFGEQGRYVLVHDRNAYLCGPNVPHSLKEHIKELNAAGKEISFVRFIRGGCYYVGSEATGFYTHSSMCAALKEEIGKPFKDHGRIVDLCVAGDGSWIVVRPETCALSSRVHEEIRTRIGNFFSNHKARQKKREEEIQEFRIAMQKKKEKKEKEEEAKKRSRIEDAIFDVQRKRLKAGDKVTIAGVSSSQGDYTIKTIDESGIVHVVQGNYDETIEDPRKIVRYEDDAMIAAEQLLLSTTSDEYESAVATYYYCICKDNVCRCHKVVPSSFVSRYLLETTGKQEFEEGDRVYVKGYANARVLSIERKNRIRVMYDDGSTYNVTPDNIQLVNAPASIQQYAANAAAVSTTLPKSKRPILEYRGETLVFDEYKCAEKIDMKRLRTIVEDLATDTSARSKMIQKLEECGPSMRYERWIAPLQRCSDLEMIATTLYNELKDFPTDENECVVREVTYEHRDPSFRGRLFAMGETVVASQSKLPRTTTLQGMHRDLRAPLVGSFAYDIDCENSEVRLLCSLATQYGLADLVPILFDYRDNRDQWLQRTMQSHDVSKSDAKILANILISGGRYETWRKRVNALYYTNLLQEFVFKLETQTRVLRDQLLKHPRFQWTYLEREKLTQQGRRGGAIEIALLPRIVQYCENEVLRILHRQFHSMGWIVRAKVFDGLIVERGTQVSTDLETSLRTAEKACQVHGWDVRLTEKPLYGRQDEVMPALTDARNALREVQNMY